MAASFIAVSWDEAELFGCPHCGYSRGFSPMQSPQSAVWHCTGCGISSLYVETGLERSTIGFGAEGRGTVYPLVEPHPRRGIPKRTGVSPVRG